MGNDKFDNALRNKLRNSNEKSAYIISSLCIFFMVLILLMDFSRWKNGMMEEDFSFVILTGFHLLLSLFFIPLFNIRHQFLKLKPIGTFKTNALLAMVILHLLILPFALVSFYTQGNLMAFAVFVLIVNLFFETKFKPKLIANICFLLIVLFLSLMIQEELPVVFLHILEVCSIISFTCIFAIHRHQNRIQSNQNELLLQKNNLLLIQQNKIIEEKKNELQKHYAIIEEKNNELQKHTMLIEEKNNELQSFAYAASHDLKEPLRMIGSYTRLIKKRLNGHLNENTKEYMGFVVDGVSNMSQMLDDLLDYATLDNSQDQYELLNLNDIFLKVKNNLTTAIHEADAQININKKLPHIHINKTYASLLFQNLICNAIKFRKKGSRPEITIDFQQRNNHVIISIQDNGIGIPKESLSSIFSIFNRLHRKDEFKGHGIGLATCKKIVDKMNGEIWAESQVGVGSCFFVKFPS